MTLLDKVGIRIVRQLRHPINTSAVIIMALYTLIWGIWLVLPFWDVFTKAELYSVMASAAPESVWGTIAMIAGTIMAWGVVRPSAKSLERGAFTGTIHWLVVAIFYFLGDWHNTGGITATMVSVYCAFVWLNLRINRGFVTPDD